MTELVEKNTRFRSIIKELVTIKDESKEKNDFIISIDQELETVKEELECLKNSQSRPITIQGNLQVHLCSLYIRKLQFYHIFF
jgi:hypothetical protein